MLANKNINFVQKNIKLIGKQIEKTKGMVSQKSIREKLYESRGQVNSNGHKNLINYISPRNFKEL